MSAPSGRSPEEREKKHKKHDSKKDKGHSERRRSSRSRVSEDSNSGKGIAKEDSSLSLNETASPSLTPSTSNAPPVPTDPVAHLHPLLWTEADVALWLQFIGEDGLTSCFDVINGVLLVNLDEEQLTNLGVTNIATRKKLMAAIGEVKERSQKVNIKVRNGRCCLCFVTHTSRIQELKEKRKHELDIIRDKESQALLAMPVQYSLPKSAGVFFFLFVCVFHFSAPVVSTTHWTLPGVPSWTVNDVGTFLDYIEIPEYKERFSTKGVTGAELLRLQDQSLVAMGIDKLGHRKARSEPLSRLLVLFLFADRKFSGVSIRCTKALTLMWSHRTSKVRTHFPALRWMHVLIAHSVYNVTSVVPLPPGVRRACAECQWPLHTTRASDPTSDALRETDHQDPLEGRRRYRKYR